MKFFIRLGLCVFVLVLLHGFQWLWAKVGIHLLMEDVATAGVALLLVLHTEHLLKYHDK